MNYPVKFDEDPSTHKGDIFTKFPDKHNAHTDALMDYRAPKGMYACFINVNIFLLKISAGPFRFCFCFSLPFHYSQKVTD